MYEEEIAFLATVEDPSDETNVRQPLNAAEIEMIRRRFPGIPEEYLAYLQEIGPGSVRECQYAIYEQPDWCEGHPIFGWFDPKGRNLLVIGDDFAGNLHAFDADNNYQIVLLQHVVKEAWPIKGGFREFIREQMLLDSEGMDQRVWPDSK